MSGRILIADDEEIMREILRGTLDREGYTVATAPDGLSALQEYEEASFDLVITDIQMSGMDGLTLLKRLKLLNPEAMVVIMTAFGSMETAVEAFRLGAFDYITKPFIEGEIRVTVRNALRQFHLSQENRTLRNQLEEQKSFHSIVGQSHVMKKIFRIVEKVAQSDANILITGESGTGKELIAQAVHENSRRADRPFVSVNCSAIPDTLMESEMFGHVKGAFTSAYVNKQGLFEEADGGTFFLDEIADLSLYTQAKLLRAIQTGEIKPVGGTKTKRVDTRIVCATNKDIDREVKTGAFREDLYYRLNVVNIHIPPLRERSEDIPDLARHFIMGFCKKYGIEKRGLSRDALKLLMNFSWPGNVRELENYIERAIALSDGDEIVPDDLPPMMQRELSATPVVLQPEGIDLDSELNSYEASLITKALQMTGGNITQAAKLLSINRRTLSSRLAKLNINAQDKEILFWRSV